jgi:TM2 domain-containing membrane protein YozV
MDSVMEGMKFAGTGVMYYLIISFVIMVIIILLFYGFIWFFVYSISNNTKGEGYKPLNIKPPQSTTNSWQRGY